ncbi:hypothetical protein [Tardiphaga sp.]|jgi:hypothetical protein|uniref:hypothetical protein n=1 Tax=Tardiphaga sp. TaxID=1926292 RepID=UPI0037DA0F1B
MGLFNWFLDAAIIAANVGTMFLPCWLALQGYMVVRIRYAGLDAEHVTAAHRAARIHVLISLAISFGIEWALYKLVGFPNWIGYVTGS